MARPAEEMLYVAMEDFRVDVVIGKGPGATAIPLDVAPFTLVGATTRAGLLPGPLRDRFGFVAHLDFYSPEELERVLVRSAGLLGVRMRPDGAEEIARRARGTPRIANRLLRRVRDYAEVRADGVVTREVAQAEGLPGGFSAVYDVLRHLEESGRIRRGYFVAGVGAMQFAQPGALDLLRSLREPPEQAEVVTIAATDPANPYGALLEWPPLPGVSDARRPARAVGAQVVLVNGEPAAYLSRGLRQVLAWLPEYEPERSAMGNAAAQAIAAVARGAVARHENALVEEVNGVPAVAHALAPYLVQAGFAPSAMGLQLTRRAAAAAALSSGAADLH
jgi:hypothetical protein